MKLISYESRAALITALADQVADELRGALAERGRASLSVPGGTTPGPMFDRLNQVDLNWADVFMILNDERWVPETSNRSNTALLRRRLLQNKAATAQLIPLYAEAPKPEDALDRLTRAVDAILPLDVLVLGMGADMHTASLFPGADQLALSLSADAPTLLAMRAPNAGEPRITLSAPVLKASRHIHILIMGPEKLTALTAAQKLDEIKAPVKSVLDNACVHWAA